MRNGKMHVVHKTRASKTAGRTAGRATYGRNEHACARKSGGAALTGAEVKSVHWVTFEHLRLRQADISTAGHGGVTHKRVAATWGAAVVLGELDNATNVVGAELSGPHAVTTKKAAAAPANVEVEELLLRTHARANALAQVVVVVPCARCALGRLEACLHAHVAVGGPAEVSTRLRACLDNTTGVHKRGAEEVGVEAHVHDLPAAEAVKTLIVRVVPVVRVRI